MACCPGQRKFKGRVIADATTLKLVEYPENAVNIHLACFGSAPEAGVTCQQSPTARLGQGEGENIWQG